jgi:polyhydroxyalkanoic acid synthase PhaR subunit
VNEKPDGDKSFDPFEAWRGIRDANMEAWAKLMIENVNSEAYAKTTGAMLDSYLTASAPFRDMMEKTMVRALEHLNMPSRDDFVSLAQRLTNIEMRLDDLDAKLDRMEAAGPDKSVKEAAARSKEKKETNQP